MQEKRGLRDERRRRGSTERKKTMLVVMLPAYNESEAVPPLLARVAPVLKALPVNGRVLLVDDGSADDTIAVARRESQRLGIALTVAEHGVNRGLGEALKTGFMWARDNLAPDDVLVVMDTDNTHDPAVIPSMLAKLAEGCDVVIASRYAPGGEEVGLSPLRALLSRGASFVLSVFLPVKGARDYSCGYRAYTGKTVSRAFATYGDDFITETGFVSSAEILIKCAYLPARVGEVPLVLRYDLKGGASKMNITDTIGRYITMIAAGRRAIRRQRKGVAA
jgi:dolichol-phosphate mannosyltransferase